MAHSRFVFVLPPVFNQAKYVVSHQLTLCEVNRPKWLLCAERVRRIHRIVPMNLFFFSSLGSIKKETKSWRKSEVNPSWPRNFQRFWPPSPNWPRRAQICSSKCESIEIFCDIIFLRFFLPWFVSICVSFFPCHTAVFPILKKCISNVSNKLNASTVNTCYYHLPVGKHILLYV